MKNLLNPKWLFIINTLPIVILFTLLLGQFNIIKTLLDEDSIRLWKIFGCSLGVLGFLNFLYAIYLTFKKKNTSIWYGLLALCSYILFLYLYGYHIARIIPFSIPQWMISDNIFLYVGTFLMPTLAYSLFILVVHFTSDYKNKNASVNFLIAIGIPVTLYLFAQTILPLWQVIDSGLRFGIHIMLVLFIVVTLIFLFFLIRSIFILVAKKDNIWKGHQLTWKVIIAIILPLIGLSLNKEYRVFGDFDNVWFYALTLVNGVLICLPGLDQKKYRLLLFFARCVLFIYTLYFFLVFLPFLPISIIAIFAVGTGFLILTPLLLFVIYVQVLSKDFVYLKAVFSKKLVIGVSFLGVLVIPAFVTAAYLKDKNVLNETLSYLYTPDYSKEYDIDKKSLQKTLNTIKGYKGRGGRGMFNGTPYLSSYFQWLVMDNLTLSDSKINKIENIFFSKKMKKIQSENIQNKNVQISNLSTSSTYDKSQKVWRSWVDLEITNKNSRVRAAEYATTIDLPEGCWISDYYLFVGDKKEPGILAEKKAAMWIFSQIRNENRDPGILYYLTGNKVAFRVFPFLKKEVRKTGIEFLHKEPVNLSIDGYVVKLGDESEAVSPNFETENMAYVSSQQKQDLKLVNRQPYFHFLIDVSKDNKNCKSDFIKRIEKVLASNKIQAKHAKISFVNSYVKTISLEGNWKEKYANQIFEGGFNLDRGIRKTLYNSYQSRSKTYPVIVTVTDSIKDAVLYKDFSDFKFAFPESDLFYNLDENGNLKQHSLIENPSKQQLETKSEYVFCETVLEYKLSDNSIVYLPNNNKPSIILKKDVFEFSEMEIKEKNWESGLIMQGQWMSQIIHPEKSNEEWLQMVRSSFITKIMTPVTSYLVVENEAQKAMLKKKQKEALSGNKSLDIGEDVQRMSEPSWAVLMLFLGLFIWHKKRREKQFKSVA